MSITLKPTSVPSKRLAVSINAATMELQLNNILGWDGEALTTADFGDNLYAVLRNDSNTVMELIELDPDTIADASITIVRRGLKFTGDRTTEVTANKLTWVKNETIVELGSDSPQLFQWLKDYIDAAANAGGADATNTTQGFVELATAAEIDADTATGGTGAGLGITPDQLVTSKYGVRLPSADQKAAMAGTGGTPSASNKFVTQSDTSGALPPVGSVFDWPMYTAPTGYLLCQGQSIARSTYAALFAVLCPSTTFTVTIASPAVFTKASHGLLVGDKIHMTTTGGLPSGLAANTEYYVISAGYAAGAFQVSLTPGGPAVNTSGTQSGVHTYYHSPWGKGDGSTTFGIPDLRQRVPVMIGQSTYSFSVDSANLDATANTFTIPADIELHQGQAITFTSSGVPTGLSSGGTYYVIRASQMATTFKLASSLANANIGTAVDFSTVGSGQHTISYTAPSSRTIVGRMGGEEVHTLSSEELQHSTSGSTSSNGAAANSPQDVYTGLGGANSTATAHNIMQPFVTMNKIIKI